MNEQPKALRLAYFLEGSSNGPLDARHKAAALLRFLHKENAELRSANAYASDVIQPMETRITTLEAALRQAVDALENHSAIKHPQQRHYRDQAITAAKQALGEA